MPRTTSAAPAPAAKRRAGLGASIGGDCRLTSPMAEHCYRHPSRETGVSCSSCGRPICPDCMTPTPVGMRCPECARERTKVKTLRTAPTTATATQVIIGINIIVFIAETAAGAPLSGGGGGQVFNKGALFGPLIVHQHEYWRILTSGFLHDGILHIAFNMFFLYVMGTILEPAI